MRNDLFKIYNYEDSWDEELRQTLTVYRRKKHNYINTILNIIIVLICVFVLNLKLWMYPIAFVITDILFTGLNILTVRYIPRTYTNVETEKALEKKIKYIKKQIAKLEKRYENGSKFYEPRQINDEIYWFKDKLKINEKKLNKLIEVKTEIKPITTVYDKINQTNTDIINEIINKISSLKLTQDLLDNDINLELVKEKANDIQKLLSEKPQFIDMACTTFKIYGKELLGVLESVMSMDLDERIGYYGKIEELITEYELHLDRLKDRIKKDHITKTNIDINVLLNEIKKDKED